MRNFGEIKINPDTPDLTSPDNNKNTRETAHLKSALLSYLSQFDLAHTNKKLTFEEKTRLYQNVFIAASITALSFLGHYSKDPENLKSQDVVESVNKTKEASVHPSEEFNNAVPLGEEEPLVNLEEIRRQLKTSYKKDMEIVKSVYS